MDTLENEIDVGWQKIEYFSGTPPTPRKSSGMTYFNQCLYIFGGNYENQLLNDFYCFSIGLFVYFLIQ